MLDFFIFYGLVGLILSILLNGLLWAMHRPQLDAIEVFACILLWPSVVASFIDALNGIEEEIEE
jgi:hypothetical protein